MSADKHLSLNNIDEGHSKGRSSQYNLRPDILESKDLITKLTKLVSPTNLTTEKLFHKLMYSIIHHY